MGFVIVIYAFWPLTSTLTFRQGDSGSRPNCGIRGLRYVSTDIRIYQYSNCQVRLLSWAGDSVGGIKNRLWSGRYGVRFPAGVRDISLLQNIKPGCGAHPDSSSMDIAGLILGDQTAEVIDDLHLRHAPQLKNSWSHTSAPFCVFVTCRGATLRLHFLCIHKSKP